MVYVNEQAHRNKLKVRIVGEFEESLKFLKFDKRTPEIVVSASGSEDAVIVGDKNDILREAAEYLSKDILGYSAKFDTSTWPPTCESVKEEEDKHYPTALNDFFSCLLKSGVCSSNKNINRLISSYGYDLIHGVTRRKIVTPKHFLLGVGLHNMTGLKLPITILSHLGHSISYDLLCEIETTEAEVALCYWLSARKKFTGGGDNRPLFFKTIDCCLYCSFYVFLKF